MIVVKLAICVLNNGIYKIHNVVYSANTILMWKKVRVGKSGF